MSASHSISITSASTYASVGTQSGQSLQPFANLDLTEAQRTSLRAILANAKKTGESKADVTKQIDALLTPAQQQTLASDLKPAQARVRARVDRSSSRSPISISPRHRARP
jgi:Spy/CpxP family protein refolding chaperone